MSNEFLAKEFSKDWYELIEQGIKKKYYFNVYYCPSTDKIEIGTWKSDSERFAFPLPLWKSLTRQLIWNNGALWVMDFLDKLIYEQSDIDLLSMELSKIDWREQCLRRTKPLQIEWITHHIEPHGFYCVSILVCGEFGSEDDPVFADQPYLT